MKPFAPVLLAVSFLAIPAAEATPFYFSTGLPDGRLASASRPGSASVLQVETADDFVLANQTSITSATFLGLLPSGFSVNSVSVEIYRVFPLDSTNPPSGSVPTRINSPADTAYASRSSGVGLSFSTAILNPGFTVANSVIDGIHSIPNQLTGGEGAQSGQEVEFTLNFTTPLVLNADHYFFVPQVELASGDFLWLSTATPIASPGTPFMPDLQSWIRNGNLDPDWLRIGTDIVGSSTFNAAFSLSGEATDGTNGSGSGSVPEPASVALLGIGLAGLVAGRRQDGGG